MYNEQDIVDFIKKTGASVHAVGDMPFKQWFDSDLSIEEVLNEWRIAQYYNIV